VNIFTNPSKRDYTETAENLSSNVKTYDSLREIKKEEILHTCIIRDWNNQDVLKKINKP